MGYCYRPYCFHLPCLDWLFGDFELPLLLLFVDWFATKICWEDARTSSSSIAYLSAYLNKSSIEAYDFLVRDSKNRVSRLILRLKISRIASML